MESGSNPANSEGQNDILIKSHAQFTDELNERLAKGEEIFKRTIFNPDQLARAQADFNSWNEYTIELLQQSFENPDNTFQQEYSYVEQFLGNRDGFQPSFHEQLQDLKTDFSRQYLRLKKIRDKVDQIATSVSELVDSDNQSETTIPDALEKLTKLFSSFHKIAQTLENRHEDRSTIRIQDEFDVQDLVRALLQEHFEDIKEENAFTTAAGSTAKVDFVLKNEKIIVGLKMTGDQLQEKEIENQLVKDMARYQYHPDCKVLVLFVYDKAGVIVNKSGLADDLNEMSANGVNVKAFVCPE